MKKLFILLICFVLFFIVVIAGGFFIFKKLFFRKISLPKIQDKITQEARQVFTGKLQDALSLGGSLKCTWKENEANSGFSFIKNKKIYTEVTQKGKKIFSILADNCIYSWEGEKTQGIKLCYPPQEEENEEEKSWEKYSGQVSGIDYQCSPAIISDSQFSPPTSVVFVNPLEMIKP